jgi:hypothetical protein
MWRGLPRATIALMRSSNFLSPVAFAALLFAGDVLAGEAAEALPQRLSAAQLFLPGSVTEIRAELLAFSPQYPLWSDGATKRRWLDLPPGTHIDARRPDAFEFPVGTRLWKEFSYDRRVETRLIERTADGSWRYATYVWNAEGTDADLAPVEGIRSLPVAGAPNSRYAIPSEADCRACHDGGEVPVLGFSALQLSADRDPLAPHREPASGTDLASLVARGWLRNLPETLLERPPRITAATPTERAALGYLHGNCGHCHSVPSATGASVPVPVVLAQDLAGRAARDRVLNSLVGAASRYRGLGASGVTQLVTPGDARHSVLPARLRSRDPRVQMPPLGTTIPDANAIELIERWINDELKLKEAKP